MQPRIEQVLGWGAYFCAHRLDGAYRIVMSNFGKQLGQHSNAFSLSQAISTAATR